MKKHMFSCLLLCFSYEFFVLGLVGDIEQLPLKPLSMFGMTKICRIRPSPVAWPKEVKSLVGMSLSLETSVLNVFLVICNISQRISDASPYASW